jgi:hypothetical protein
VAVAVSDTGALNVDGATSGESVAVAVSAIDAGNDINPTSESVAVAVSATDAGNNINPTSESVAVAVSSTGALNVDSATLGESVAVAVSTTGALNVDSATLGESVAVAVSAITAVYITPAKLQPVLFPPSTFPLAVAAFQIAPPVPSDLLIEQKETETVPLAFDSVWLAAVSEPIVIKFPAVPDKLKLLNVVVVPAVNSTDAG